MDISSIRIVAGVLAFIVFGVIVYRRKSKVSL